ncbi:DJ-1/PfpI family protein [Streptomyces sp. NPDC023723]|uniref:DJ-1/PfpI family protein n=1 Tax=Streptomyces sp. NPDC023723 TaxID=3154323 RepID=UPI0033C10A71
MHVQIVLFDGFDPLDVVAPFEVLHGGRTATGGAVSVELVCAEGPREVVGGTGGLTLRASAALDPERPGWVLVPGASGRVGEPGAEPGDADDLVPVRLGRALTTRLPELMRTAMAHPEVKVATVCGGSALLAMAGLLEGRHATTHHLGMDLLDATGAHAVRARVVDDGDLVSGAGVTSGLDLALHLLDRGIGPRVAHAVEELFAHERRGIVWRATGPRPASL